MRNSPASIPEMFRGTARQHAERIAITTADEDWTYAELDERSDAVAVQVLERARDVAKPVALLMQHGAPLIAAILGVLKAGRIYVSLDPQNPTTRLASVLPEAGSELLLTDGANASRARELAGDRMSVLELGPFAPASSPPPAWPSIPPETPAWLMFTSGSTGTPKGVWQSHSSVVHRAQVYAELIQLTPADRLSLLTATSLAASATHLFTALLHGAALAPFALRTEGVGRAAAWLQAQRITVCHCVPTVFRHLARAPDAAQNFSTLRMVRLGGEPLLRGDVELFQQLCPDDCRLLHAFSSTETGLIAALLLDRNTPLPNARVPVGRPVRDVEVLILDEQGRQLPAGETGRIAVRSAQMQQGYWRQPVSEAESFRPDPENPRRRIFVSKDLGRLLPDGALEHLGRTDALVKIRGWRVDLAEVEAALNATGFVAECAVLAPEDETGERRLVAYYVPHTGPDVEVASLRRALASLPEHVLPGSFVPLERLPQTAGGKIDRRALPALTPARSQAAADFVLPLKGVERTLAEIWEAVLGVSPVGRHDDFFALGGSSLHSTQVLSRIQERFDLVLSPSTLVECSTIAVLGERVAQGAVRTASGPLVMLRETSTAQRPLFLIHGAEGDVALYGQLVRRLPERTIYGFQCPGLNGECDPVLGIPQLARLYLAELQARDPSGPYLLGGTRMGAWVVFEMAQQLHRLGKPVGLLALFDFYLPRPRRIIDPLVFGFTKMRDRLRVKVWARRRARRVDEKSQWLANYRQFVAKMNCHSRHDYQFEFYPGALTLFVTADRLTERKRLVSCAREVRVREMPGDQDGLLVMPAVEVVARELQLCLEETERDHPARPVRAAA